MIGVPYLISSRASSLPPFYVMEILERANAIEKEGFRVIHMEVGEPDFDTPVPIQLAAIEAMKRGATRYTSSLGIPELREAIAEWYRDRYNVTVSPDCILITNGTSPALHQLFGALLDPGDELILSNPCYACYPNMVEFVGGVPRYIDVTEDDGFKFNPGAVGGMITDRVKGVMVNSPCNPTGIVLSNEDLSSLVDATDERAWLVSDEIYHGLVYGEREHSVLEFTDKAFVLNGFSKLFAMTGWRLGYIISPPEFVRPLQKVQQNLSICANGFVQHAGIAALRETDDYVRAMVTVYDERRRFLLGRVREMGFTVKVEPTGAFYIFANASRFTDDCHRFCLDVLEDAHVGITPGIDFGSGGEGFVRFSYANSIENIAEGCDRLERYLAEHN